VGDQEGRQAQVGKPLGELARHARLGHRVEGRQRLVEQQDVWGGRDRARERGALTLAARRLARSRVSQVGDAVTVEQFVDASAPLAPLARPRPQTVLDVASDGQVGEQRPVLEHQADVAALRRQVHVACGVGERASPERDARAVRLEQPGDGA